MIAHILILLSFIYPQELHQTKTSYEQIAFDHFLQNVFDDNYIKGEKAFFSGFANPSAKISGSFYDCFSDDGSFEEFRLSTKPEVSNQLEIEFHQTKLIRRSSKLRRRGLNINVYRSVKDDNFAYVYLTVFRFHLYTDHYLIKISLSELEVIDICRRNEQW